MRVGERILFVPCSFPQGTNYVVENTWSLSSAVLFPCTKLFWYYKIMPLLTLRKDISSIWNIYIGLMHMCIIMHYTTITRNRVFMCWIIIYVRLYLFIVVSTCVLMGFGAAHLALGSMVRNGRLSRPQRAPNRRLLLDFIPLPRGLE